jgi:hypothetical protein
VTCSCFQFYRADDGESSALLAFDVVVGGRSLAGIGHAAPADHANLAHWTPVDPDAVDPVLRRGLAAAAGNRRPDVSRLLRHIYPPEAG